MKLMYEGFAGAVWVLDVNALMDAEEHLDAQWRELHGFLHGLTHGPDALSGRVVQMDGEGVPRKIRELTQGISKLYHVLPYEQGMALALALLFLTQIYRSTREVERASREVVDGLSDVLALVRT